MLKDKNAVFLKWRSIHWQAKLSHCEKEQDFLKKTYGKLIFFCKRDLAKVEQWGLYLGSGVLALEGCTEGENRNYWDLCMCFKFYFWNYKYTRNNLEGWIWDILILLQSFDKKIL